MAGKPPKKRIEEFVRDTYVMSTSELSLKYDRAASTIRDWKQWAKARGLEVGDGSGHFTGEDGEVYIEGITPDYSEEMLPIEELWERAKNRQKEEERRQEKRDGQIIKLPDVPIAIGWFSDIHIGSPHVDYVSAHTDFITVANTKGFYGGFHGDLGDNWIIGRLQAQARNQRLSIQDEIRLGLDLLKTLGDKLLWAVPGNHDNWEYVLSGRDSIAEALKGTRLLYDPHEVVFTLTVGDAAWVVKVRHQWRGYSIFNDSHGIEVGWERGDTDFDIGVGGHLHTGTWLRPFHRHRKRRYALVTGTYKTDDGYARRMGFRGTCGLGSGATVMTPNGDFVFFEDVRFAAQYLTYLRQEWGAPT